MARRGFAKLVALGVCGTLAACSSVGTNDRYFVSSVDQSISGFVKGTARAAKSYGGSCGGSDIVTLTPVTPAVETVVASTFGNTDVGSVRYSSDPNAGATSRASLPAGAMAAKCNRGRFEFDQVPAGEYFAMTYISKNEKLDGYGVGGNSGEVGDSGIPGPRFRAVSMMQRITVIAGEKTTVHLRPRNAIDYRETQIAKRTAT